MASSRRRRIRAHREQALREHELPRRRDAVAHSAPVRGFDEALVRWMAVSAFVALIAVALVVLLA